MGADEPDEPADHWSPEQCRGWLLALARRLLGHRFPSKIDPEDIVQETLRKAHARRSQFQGGDDEARRRCWLRAILRHTLLDEVDKLVVRNECAVADLREQSSVHLEELLEADQSSPSARALSAERRVQLAEALALLPPEWRVALELHHWEGCSVAEVGRVMGRSRGAAAGMIARAYQRLRGLLSPPEGEVS
jgi:RNA polymerase sigma-70 factor (ECF subfamily)